MNITTEDKTAKQLGNRDTTTTTTTNTTTTTTNNNNNNRHNRTFQVPTNVEPEMYDYTNNNWSHCNSIIGATGIVTRSLRKNLEAVPGKHSIDSLQKTAIHGTAHIIRKVMQREA